MPLQIHKDFQQLDSALDEATAALEALAKLAGQDVDLPEWFDDLGDLKTAVQSVEGKINALASHLQSSDSEVLIKIGTHALNDVLNPISGNLVALAASPGDLNAARATLKTIVADFTSLLTTDEVVAIDGNPFKITVGVNAALSPSLTALSGKL
ncbi:MAG: hypothetical protein AAFV53_14325 [Myxococcota bacterium]